MFFSKKLKSFDNVNHCFFSKNGGVSHGVYNSLNCGLGSADKKKNVLKNLNIVSKKVGVNFKNLFTMRQTHSNKVAVLNESNKDEIRINSDALITSQKNVAIAVLTADCVPILLYDEVNEIIGSIHAGWRGAVNGIIKNTLSKIIDIGKKTKINVAIGPCINMSNYEVGQEFYEKFVDLSKKNKKFFLPTKDKKFLFDLRKYVNLQFEQFDINHIENIDFDTFSESKKFFSFRRSKQVGEVDYGRCISVIKMNND